jgi:hypothetical protein
VDMGTTLHLAHTTHPAAKPSMPPPPLQTYNSVLGRTIHNIEKAQGLVVHHATMSDIFRAAKEPEQADMISLPSTSDEIIAPSPPPSDDYSSDAAAPAPTRLPTVDLISDLNCSTALVQNLRIRNTILAADLARVNTSLTHHEEKMAAILLIESRRRVKWMATAAFAFVLWMVYLAWCWFMRVEFAYIRKRRGEFFGL